VHDAGITFAIRVAGAVVAFALQAMLSRLMASAEFGAYIIIWSWLLSLGSLATLGLSELAIRMVPRYASRNRHHDVATFFRFSLKAIIIGSSTLACFAILAATILEFDQNVRTLIILVAIGIPFIAIEYFLDDIARASGWYRMTSIPIYIIRPLAVGCVCLAISLLGFTLDQVIVSLIVIAALGATSLAVFPAIISEIEKAPLQPDTSKQNMWLRAALPMLAAASMNDLILNGDVILIGVLLSENDAAIYFVASRVLIIASFAQHALNYVFGRRFSVALAERRLDVLKRDFWNSTAVALAASVGAALAGILTAPWLLKAFSQELQSAVGIVALVSIAFIARGASSQAHEFLTVAGETSKLLLINAVSICIGLIGALLVANTYGLLGVILAINLAAIARAVALLSMTTWHLRNSGA
jgi:O-antigen/teichoic acid export membrane protein